MDIFETRPRELDRRPLPEIDDFMPIEKNSFAEVVEKSVEQNDFQEEVISPDDKKVHMLHTVGRIGCDAALLLTIGSDGKEHVLMTHYDPDHVDEHLMLLKEKTAAHPEGKRFAVLLTMGREDAAWRGKVTSVLQEYLNGGNPDVVVLPDLGLEQAKELGTALGRLNYQLCFTRGYGGDMKQHRISVPEGNYEKDFPA